MTRPIYEPNLERTDAELSYGNQQLFRRPAPSPSAIIPAPNPNYFDFPVSRLGAEWWASDGFQSGYSYVTDATYPLGGYLGATADAKYFVIGFILGPAGSRWTVALNLGFGPDYGKLQLQWGQTPVQVEAADSDSGVVEPQYIYDPGYVPAWYQTNNADLLDTYAAAPSTTGSLRGKSTFYISGDAGDQLSSNGIADPYPSTVSMNGSGDGSHIWWMKGLTSGKNASSTGYRIRINQIRVHRIPLGGYQII